MATTLNRIAVRDDYLKLIQRLPLAPIRNERHFKQAIAILDELAIIDERKLTPGQADYLIVLSDLVESYEDRHHAIDLSDLDGIDALKHLLEENHMNASDLGRLLGNRQLGAAILRRQRQLSKAHIATLCQHFKVHAELFL